MSGVNQRIILSRASLLNLKQTPHVVEKINRDLALDDGIE